MQRYFVILKSGEIYNTEWFDEENFWSDTILKVIDTNTVKELNNQKSK